MKSLFCTASLLLICSRQAAAQQPPVPAEAVHLVDAVKAAIARHPAVEIQQQEVEINSALQKQASGAFDHLVETGLDREHLHSPISGLTGFTLPASDVSDIAASYTRLLRSGVTMNGTIDMHRQIDMVTVPGGLNTSSTQFQLTFPLMRGRGREVTTSGERAAGLSTTGSVLDLKHVTASVVTRVVSSYWALVAAAQNRSVTIAAAERAALLVDHTRALIAADQSPRSDLASALANAADREAARYASEQAYVEAREQLWLDMGFRQEDRVEIAAVDDFSLFGELPKISDLPVDAEPFIPDALTRRADNSAAQDRIEAARIVRSATANELRPQVDFSLNVGYTALAEGRGFDRYWSAVASGIEGPNISGTIKYRFPVNNHLAAGRFEAADAQLRQATANREDIARTIRSSVITSYSALRNSLLRLEQARASVNAFQEALQGEQDKLALGIGSIINVLTIEDHLTAAAAGEVAALQSYGQALVEFRFATGRLVPAQGDLPAIDERMFTTFPSELIPARP